MLRRALLRGKISLLEPSSGALLLLKSVLAVPVYVLVLPVVLLGASIIS